MTAPKRNIVLVINDLKGNGAERVVITLANGFIEAGHRASIICFKRHIELPIPESIPVYIFSEKQFRWIPRRLRGLLTAPWLDRFIKKHAGTPDLVLSSLMPSDRILAYSKLTGVHFIIHNTTQVEVDSYNPKKKNHEIAQRLKIYRRKPCICVSKGVEEDLRDMLSPIALPLITTIHNPVEVEKIKAAASEITDDLIPNAIICVGKFKKQKRQDRLIRAYRTADCPYPLVFIGQGPLLPEARNLVDELKLNDRVHFMGFRKNPYPYIKAARLHVLCSDYEGLGVVILEALCLKTPTISSDCPSGPSEILPPENLFKTDDMGAFVQLLKNASLSPELFQVSLAEQFCSHYAARKYLNLCR
jgi:glycosyltransferase involved in cell wall biosynthesis